MSKIFITASKDNNFYNFRKELIIKLVELGNKGVLIDIALSSASTNFWT